MTVPHSRRFLSLVCRSYAPIMLIVDARSLDDSGFAAALKLQQRLDRRRDPGLPVTPAAELRAIFDDDATDHSRHQRIVALDGHSAIAIGHLELTIDPANAALAGVEITPADDEVSAAVLAEMLRRARDDGRTSVMAWGDHTPARHRFWTSLGAELRYTEQESSLDMAAVDPELMQRWIEAGPADLELVHWAGRCPEQWIDALVAAANAMNDAPTDDLDVADTVVDVSMMRAEIEAPRRPGAGVPGHSRGGRRRGRGRRDRDVREPPLPRGVVAVEHGGAARPPRPGHRTLDEGIHVAAAPSRRARRDDAAHRQRGQQRPHAGHQHRDGL